MNRPQIKNDNNPRASKNTAHSSFTHRMHFFTTLESRDDIYNVEGALTHDFVVPEIKRERKKKPKNNSKKRK